MSADSTEYPSDYVVIDENGEEIDRGLEDSFDFVELSECPAREAGFATPSADGSLNVVGEEILPPPEGPPTPTEAEAPKAETSYNGDAPAPSNDKPELDDVKETDEVLTHSSSWNRVGSDEELNIDKLLKKARYKGELWYLVKYTSHEEPLWETAEYLYDEGHKPHIDRFENERVTTQQVTLRQKQQVERREAQGAVRSRYVVPDGLYNAFQQMPFLIELIVRRVAEDTFCNTKIQQYHVTKVKVLNHGADGPLKAFTEQYLKKEHYTTDVLFYGAPKKNYAAVCGTGQLVKGAHVGIRMAPEKDSGCIYTAREPSIPLNYYRKQPIFACIGLIKRTVMTNKARNIVAFPDANCVVPVAALECAPGARETKGGRAVIDVEIDTPSGTRVVAYPISSKIGASKEGRRVNIYL